MKVMIVGRWGKAHAVGKALVRDGVTLYSFMDKKNQGIAELSTAFHMGDLRDKQEILNYTRNTGSDLVFVSPEMALKRGVTDYLEEKGIPSVGPTEFCSKFYLSFPEGRGTFRLCTGIQFSEESGDIFSVADRGVEAIPWYRPFRQSGGSASGEGPGDQG